MTDGKDTAAKTKPLISKENAQNRPETIQRETVLHADEINKAVSEELGKPVYHYHLHIVAIPTVRKEILWSKRCKDEALRGMVKEVINQVSHSKKWKNTVPLLDENGQQVISKYGKPMFRKSYSVLQDKLFAHMTEAGFTGFERGVLGSTAENLSSLDYQIQKDKERLADIQERIEAEQVRYEPVHEVRKTMAEMPSLNICRRADNTCFVSSVKSTIMPTEAISAQCSKKFIIKVYSLPYKVVFQIIILGNFPVLTRCDPCSFFEYLHKAYLISVSAEVGYFLNGHIGGRKIILSCLDLCG